ncbi:MAG: hypothetical protein ACREFQ_13595, partial [Stellaceae bacterium]
MARRLARGEVYYALGRFAVARRAYSSLRVGLEAVKGAPALPLTSVTVFPEIVVAEAVANLRRDGVALGLKLAPELQQEILAYAERTPFVPL